jgi:hypothetical protein
MEMICTERPEMWQQVSRLVPQDDTFLQTPFYCSLMSYVLRYIDYNRKPPKQLSTKLTFNSYF